jgi:PAS domain S-box-containing protein
MSEGLDNYRGENLTVDALVIDDNVAWTELIRNQIEERTTQFNITVAGGATEAQSVLSSTTVDCIVCDYHMPGMDGIEFLNHVQQEFEPLPFILLTGRGGEEIASEAISQGVSDYVKKEEVREQPSALLNRINNAVEKHRLQDEIKKQRKQYQSIAQQTIEAVCITEDDEIVFANNRFTDIIGDMRDDVVAASISDVLETNTNWVTPTQDESRPQTQQITVQTGDSSERIYQVKRKKTQIGGTESTFWSFRDITDLKNSKERLQYERDLSQIIVDILVQSSTTDTLELSFCNKITNYEQFSLAWVGEPVQGSRLSVQAYAGDGSEYLSQIEPALSDADETLSAPPSLWALRRRESQFLSDISTLPETQWQQAAVAQGFKSVVTFPLMNDDLCHGVFCVYSTETAVIDERLKQLLERLSRALAGALADKKNAAALTSNEVVEIRFKITGTDFYLNDVLRDETLENSHTSVSIGSVIQRSEQEFVEFLQVNGSSTDLLANQLREHRLVDTVASTSPENANQLRVETSGLTLAGRLKQLGAKVHSIVVNDGIAEVTVQLPVERDQHTVLNQLEEEYTVEAIVSHTTKQTQTQGMSQPQLSLTDINLTEKQTQAVKTAYQAGYFTKPRGNSAREVAEMLDISHTTFLQHLRAAQQKVFENMFNS